MALLPRGSVRFVDVPVMTLPIVTSDLPALARAGTAARAECPCSPRPSRPGGRPAGRDRPAAARARHGRRPAACGCGRPHLAAPLCPPDVADCRRPCVAVLITGLGLAEQADGAGPDAAGRGRTVVLALCRCCRLAGAGPCGRARGAARCCRCSLSASRVTMPGRLPCRYPRRPTRLRTPCRASLPPAAAMWPWIRPPAPLPHSAASFAPVAEQLAARGLGLIEIGGDALGGAGSPGRDWPMLGVPWQSTSIRRPRRSTRRWLASMPRRWPVGVPWPWRSPLPASFDRLAAWIATLPGAGASRWSRRACC